MLKLPASLGPIREGLLRVGFSEDRLRSDFIFPSQLTGTGLLAFSDRPMDSRTAAVAALAGERFTEADVAMTRPCGAPLLFTCLPTGYQVWKQGVRQPQFICSLTSTEVPGYFLKHSASLAPDAIYRAKTWARLDNAFQLDFVDAGLMPVIEAESGEKLRQVIERVVSIARNRLGWKEVSDHDGRWLLQAIFWLLAAKILQDKQVQGFIRVDLTDLDAVYERLSRHYNSKDPKPVSAGGKERRAALVEAANEIKKMGNCGLVSTEALAHLYESALIDRVTRQRLGTHSTPPWMVDYIVGRLRPWIAAMSPEDRRVFEPACGHAAFLISAMRLLSELWPSDGRESRQSYLRRRLHGMERDPFALEIARLSLTLADVPNPNGWALTEADMFPGDRLKRAIREASIVLGNPPFEAFDAGDRQPDWLHNKAAETFRRVVENLKPGAVFGFVLPQTLLHSQHIRELRETLLRHYEISEISLFADKVFRYGEPESTIIIGRRTTQDASRQFMVRYQRIREGQVEDFARTYSPSSEMSITQERLLEVNGASLLVPEFYDLWQSCLGLKRLAEFADIGKGFDHRSLSDPKRPRGAITGSPIAADNCVPGFSGWKESQFTHELPIISWLNLDPKVILTARHGTKQGKPQVILNYARVSREAWRLKALLDDQGHPVTSRFMVVRPREPFLSLFAVWGLLNSPIANAYTYCPSSKRDVLVGDLRRMPVPDLKTCDLEPLESSVANYLRAVKAILLRPKQPKTSKDKNIATDEQLDLFDKTKNISSDKVGRDHLKFLHWRIDAEVLKLYNLPSKMERRLLDLFAGVRRRGVPFEQMEYFPKDFTDLDRLGDLLAITVDWEQTNQGRGRLMDLEDEGRLTPAEADELANLQRLADALLSLMNPWKPDEVDHAVEQAKEHGVWKS